MCCCMVQGSFPAAFVVQGQACLEGKASHCHRPFLCQFSCLSPTNDPLVDPSFLPKTRWYALYPLSLIFDSLAWFTASQSSSNPSMCVLRGSTSSTVPSGVALQVVFRRFQLSLQKCQCTNCAADQRQGCGAFRMIAANGFNMRSSRSLPIGLEGEQHAANTRCSWQVGCAFRRCSRKTSEVRQHH